MNREYHKWYSPSLNRDMEMLVYGYAGAPVIVFPTSQARFYEYEDRDMVGTLWDRIEYGHLQLYCLDSVDSESWYNYGAHPAYRAARQNDYDRYITNEVLGFIGSRNSNNFLITTGCSFGAYQAVNYGFRHPDIVRKVVALSGRYNLHNYVSGYYSDDVYYNTPLDYINGVGEGDYLNNLRRLDTILAICEWDVGVCAAETRQLSNLLNSKGIGHTLDVWAGGYHDWPLWKEQIRKFL